MILGKYFFLTKGVGKDKDKLASFEAALRDAGIAPFNIVKVSSILPPGCKLISRSKGLKMLTYGEVIFTVMSENQTNEPHRLIGASVGVAIPGDESQYGYLSEYHAFGESEAKMGLYAENIAAYMLATTLGEKVNTEDIQQNKHSWKISGKIVKTMNITQTAIGDKEGLWTTVIAAAVLIPG